MNLELLNLKEEDLKADKFIQKREELLGQEKYFSGTVRQNKLFNNLEFFVSSINELDIDKLIEVLEK